MATDLHGGLVQRQPPPRRFRIPFDDTPRIFAAHAGTRTNHGTFQPCAGTSVASVSSFIAGASQINFFVLPLSYSAQERPLSQAYAPCGCEARGHAYGTDSWELNPPHTVLETASPPWYMCPHIAPSERSRSPAHQEKKGEKKKNGDAEFAPASPMIKCVFSIFPLLSGIFKIYFSAISTTQG